MKIKKVLVVYNKPLYQQLILEQKDPYYQKLFQSRHPSTRKWVAVYEEHHKTLEGVVRTLDLLGMSLTLRYRKDLRKVGKEDLVVTVGGDGTVLETSHFLSRQTLLGVNAAPEDSTGALCGARLATFLSTVIDLMTGEKKPVSVPRLQVKVGKKVCPDPALNEVLFANRSPAGTSRYIFQVGKKREEQKSSGVWVSTGAGSTAALGSAGGKRLPAGYKGLQYWVRELVQTPANTPRLQRGILPAGKALTFIPTTRQSAVFIDGNHIEIPVEYGETVTVNSNYRPLKLVMK